MGLDVYVGTLTRRYGGESETIIQQMGAAGGTERRTSRISRLGSATPASCCWQRTTRIPRLRATQATDVWDDDPAWKLARHDDFANMPYSHILRPSMWLPCEFAHVFSADDLTGDDEVVIASSVTLLAQLRALNERTYQ